MPATALLEKVSVEIIRRIAGKLLASLASVSVALLMLQIGRAACP